MEKDFEYRNIEELGIEGNEIVDMKKIFERDNFRSIYAELKQGKAIPMHAHDENDQSAIILEGEGEYIAAGRKIKVTKGTSWFVKAGVEHSLVNTGSGRIKYFEFVL